MAARLEEALAADCELIAGGGGIFDVMADGKLVYSKHATGEFPEPDALVSTLRG